MSSKRFRSTSFNTSNPKKNVSKASVRNSESGGDECENREEMTIQQMKLKLSNGGLAKGAKQGLVSPKSKMNGEGSTTLNQVNSDEKSKTYSTRSKGLSDRDHDPIINNVSDISGVNKTKRRVKQSIDTIEIKTFETTTEQELISESIKGEGEASTRAKRKVSSKTSTSNINNNIVFPEEEPWMVLTHKKPQKGWAAYNPKTMRPPPIGSGIANMKLMSWNVNGLRALLKLEGFSALQLAQRENFDVLCLQETKLQEKDVDAIRQILLEGYDDSYWSCSVSKLGYSGTAIISRIKPLSVRYGLGIADHDTEGRLVTVEFEKFYLLSSYVPNSSDGLKRLPYRITQWDPSLSNYMKELERSKPVILTGDLNCAHQEIDIYNPAGNKRSAGFTIEERESFQTNFLERGFVDTFRKQHPDVVGYTYWGYRHDGRKTNKGWRLDYFLTSESIASQVHDSYILPDVAGSDHSPIGLILKL